MKIIQKEAGECGLIVVRYLIGKFYKNSKIGYLPLKNTCKNFLEIQQSLEDFGIFSEGLEITNHKEFLCNKKINPFIAQIEFKKEKHFIIVLKIIGKFALVYFPESGTKIISVKKLFNISTSNILYIRRFERKKKRVINLIKAKEVFNLTLLSLFSLTGIICFLQLLNNQKLQLFSFLLVPFILLLFYLTHFYNLKIFKRMDQEVFASYLEKNVSEREFYLVNQVKTSFIQSINNKITGVFILFFFVYYAIFSSLNQVLLVSLSYVTNMFFLMLFKNLNGKKILTINNLERDLLKEFDSKKYIMLDKLAINLTKTNELRKLISCVLILFYSFFFSLILKEGDFSGFILNFLTTIFITFYLEKTFTFFYKAKNPYLNFLSLDKSIYLEEKIYA